MSSGQKREKKALNTERMRALCACVCVCVCVRACVCACVHT